MIFGVDTSSYLEEEAANAKYYVDGKEVDPLSVFVSNGIQYSRIRLWVDPYGPNGEPYLGGTLDIDNFIKLARICIDHGMRLMLDFHFSDFWCDPSKQCIPKSWHHDDIEGLKKDLEDYIVSTLKRLKEEGLEFDFIQVGNEITNGFLWPLGKIVEQGENQKRGNYDNFISLLQTAIKAVKSVYPESKIIVHLEKSYSISTYEEFFGELKEHNVEFDIIGMSYYPFWHGTFSQLFANIDNLHEKFGKDIIIVETGYSFTLEDYYLTNNGTNNLIVNAESIEKLKLKLPYPLTEQGQADFLSDLLKLAKKHDVKGIFYWEPLWIPGKDICWTSKAGQQYINELGKATRNEWANQALYDYGGRALKALHIFNNKE